MYIILEIINHYKLNKINIHNDKDQVINLLPKWSIQ